MKYIFLNLLFTLCLLVSTICGQSNEPIRVGAFFDMTGQTASFGISSFSGIKLAIDEINAAGGIDGRQIELFLEDDQGKPENVERVVKKLIEEKKVHVLLGEVLSTNSLIAAPLAQAAKIPMISPSSTNEKVTKVGDYIFRTCFIDALQGEAMAKFAFENLKVKRVAILTDFNSTYAKGLTDSFAATFIRKGGKIVINRTYFQGDEDYFPQLKAIKKARPDAIYLSGYYNSVAVLAQQARQLKITSTFLGGDGWDAPEIFQMSDNYINNSYITNHFTPDSPDENVKKFAAQYKKLFGLDSDAFAALAYDAVYVLADSIKRAKSTEGEKLRDAIAKTKDVQGVTGKITLDSNRNAIKPVVIQKLQNPNFVYQSIIQP